MSPSPIAAAAPRPASAPAWFTQSRGALIARSVVFRLFGPSTLAVALFNLACAALTGRVAAGALYSHA